METNVIITEVRKGDTLILKVKGKLDTISSPILEKKVFNLMVNGQKKLLIDLAEVQYINSAGLRMLLSIKKQIKALSGKFIVCSMTKEVMEIIRLCGFDHVLDLADSEEAAFKKFE